MPGSTPPWWQNGFSHAKVWRTGFGARAARVPPSGPLHEDAPIRVQYGGRASVAYVISIRCPKMSTRHPPTSPHEDCHLQHQQRQQAFAEPFALAKADQARHRLPSGIEM